jgi:hypothetical protein
LIESAPSAQRLIDTMQDLYQKAHLFVAAIRLWEHRRNAQPTISQVCQSLDMAIEPGHLFAKKLKDLEILQWVEGAYETRLCIKDHLKIEDIPRTTDGSKLQDEIKKFEDAQKNLTKQVEAFKSKQDAKKKSVFDEIEKKLKEKLSNDKTEDPPS